MYLSLEKVESHQEFWRALLIVSSATLEALREERSIGTSAYQAQTRANAAVKAEITRLLSGKSHDQLVQLQQQVQAKLASGEVIDVDYWEGLLKELVVQKAKAKLRDMHEVVLNNRLEQLRKKQRDEALRYAQEVKNAIFVPPPADALEGPDNGEDEEEEMQIEEEEEQGGTVVAEKWDDKWEPVLHNRIPEECRACQVVDFAEDRQKLVRQPIPFFLRPDRDPLTRSHHTLCPSHTSFSASTRQQYAARRAVAQARFVVKPRTAATGGDEAGGSSTNKDEEIYQAAVGQGFDEEEEFFNMEAEMSKQSYTWEDKYRPRKPRYFNKVHTGYEWNKYNQTHYEYVSLSPSPLLLLPLRLTVCCVTHTAPTTLRPKSSKGTSSTSSIPTSSTRPKLRVRLSLAIPPQHYAVRRLTPALLDDRIPHHQEQGEPRHLHDRLYRRTAVRGHCVHDREPAVGALAQARVPQLVRPRSAPAALFVPPQFLQE